ncbi:MAG: HdeD family acid-resistance protein [Terracidiphilus sp.]
MGTPGIGGIIKESAGWGIALSVLMIVAGLLAIAVPPAAGIAVAIIVAWVLAFSGAFHFVFAWYMRSTSGFVWELALGLIYLALGLYMLIRPVTALVSLTLLLVLYLFAKGLLELILAIRLRPMPGTKWFFLDGTLTLIMGLLITIGWPSSSEWAIGLLIGISILLAGISRLSLAMAVRRAV